jgi:hypothetical protein
VDPVWLAIQGLQAEARTVSLASTDDGATARVPAIVLSAVQR